MNRCPTAESPSDCPSQKAPTRLFRVLSMGASVALLAGLTSACGIFLPTPCGDPEEICPNLACEEYVANDDGCSICECVVDPTPEPTVCWDDSECATDQRCDTENFCETPPGCSDDQPCPAVCYGRCVDDVTGCTDDSECGPNQHCRIGGGVAERPDGSDEAAPAPCADGDTNCQEDPIPVQPPEGICVDDGCAEDDARVVAPCPPGTEPVYTGGNCGEVICVAIDECRDLDPLVCENSNGCELIEVPGVCECGGSTDPVPPGEEGAAEPCFCDDEVQQVCVPSEESCFGLGEEACFSNPNCEGYYTGSGVVPCECAPDDANCGCEEAFPMPPQEEFVCVDRNPIEGCRDSRDCFGNERCELSMICTDDCFEAEDGTVGCLSECWEVGQCVPTERSCYDIFTPEECLSNPDCQLVEGGGSPGCDCSPEDPNCGCAEPIAIAQVCEPRARPTCFSDFDCAPTEYCEVEEWCPPCVDGSDPGCFAPCWVEGRCIEGDPEPDRCGDDIDCGEGLVCETVTICEGGCGETPPPDPDAPGDPLPAPPPCDEFCYDEGICVPESRPTECYGDFDCGEGFFCEVYDNCIGPPDCVDCLIACAGQCRPTSVEPGYCLTDDDCAEGTACATETDICFIDPTGVSNECFHECVAVADEGLCLENSDCAEGQRCALELDECACPVGDPNCSVCFSRCVDDTEVCDQVETGGLNPESGECELFSTPCDVPADWERCERPQP